MNNKFTFFTFMLASFVALLVFSGQPALALQMPTASGSVPAVSAPAGAQTSFNWSGYETAGGSFTGVSAGWNVPVVTNNTYSADATWVGIGGVSSQDLIQAGTQAIVNRAGQIQYQAWYELLPGNSQSLPMTVNGGDAVTFSITQTSPGQWVISARDNTNGQTYQQTETYNSSLSSAEWIEEMPIRTTGSFLPLDNFGSVQFTNAYAIKNGVEQNLAQAGAGALVMVNQSGQSLATPSGFGPDGASFTVTRSSATATQAGTSATGRRNRLMIFKRRPNDSLGLGYGSGFRQQLFTRYLAIR